MARELQDKSNVQQTDLSRTVGSEGHRKIAATRISVAIAFVTLIVFGFVMAGVLPVKSWKEANILVALLAILFAAAGSAFTNRTAWNTRALNLMVIVIWTGATGIILLNSGMGVVLAVGLFTLTIVVAVEALPSDQINRVILIGTGTSTGLYLLDLLISYPRLEIAPQIQALIPFIVVLELVFFIIYLFRRYTQLPLLTKIVVPFVMVSLLSIGALAAYTFSTSQMALTNAANQTLRAAALQTAAQIDAYFSSIKSSLRLEATLPAFVEYINLPQDSRTGSPSEMQANNLLRFLQGRGFILDYSILDAQGNVLMSTLASNPESLARLPRHLGIDRTDPNYLSLAFLTGDVYVSPVIYDITTGQPSIYFAINILNRAGLPVALLVSHYSIRTLQGTIIVPNNGLAGQDSFAVLIDENGLRLAHGVNPQALDKLVVPPPEEVLKQLVDQFRLPGLSSTQVVQFYPEFATGIKLIKPDQPTSFFTTQELGLNGLLNAAAVNIREQPWKVVFLQPQEVLLSPVQVAVTNTTLIVVIVTCIAVLAAALIARVISQPVIQLTEVANRVSQGDLEVQLIANSTDEIGTLTTVFNSMTSQLNQTLNKLEQHVAERTRELADANTKAQRRSQQLEAISDISRVITTERDLQKLLPLVVRIISERLGFYHTGIFLLDQQREYAVLRAANSEGGQRMLKRSHRLRVGQQGIIGYVTGTGYPRVALDVGEDAVFFNNPDLPQTRSEIGLPLTLGDHLIGALDVQSTEAGAFSEEDINLLSTLADQVTIAIENARLFSETEQALHELQEVQRTYLRSQWDRQIEMRRNLGFAYEDGRTYPLPLSSEQQAAVPKAKTSPSLLSIPIALRDEVIGYIDLQQVDEGRAWTEEEIHLAQSVAQQIGLALENARLIEETQHRAERESLVSQITTRLRASTDQQAILQTAVSELRNALRVRTAHIVIPAEKPEPGRRGNYTRLANRPTGSDQNSSANSKGSAADPSVSLTTDEEIG